MRRSASRRGWSSLETPTGWYQVIRGPRPKAVQWPRRQWWSLSSWWQQAGQWPELKSQQPQKIPAAEMATRASTRNQPHGCGTHQGSTVAERHRRIGRPQVSRSSVVGSSIRGSPASSSGATSSDSSRRIERDGSSSGSVDQIAGRDDESGCLSTHAGCRNARPDFGGSSSVAGSGGTVRTRSTGLRSTRNMPEGEVVALRQEVEELREFRDRFPANAVLVAREADLGGAERSTRMESLFEDASSVPRENRYNPLA